MKPLVHKGTPVGWRYFINAHGKRSAVYNVMRRTTTPSGNDVIHSEIIYRKI